MSEPRTQPPHREILADHEIGHTRITRCAARALAGCWLVLVCTVPLFQAALDIHAGGGWARVFSLAPSLRDAVLFSGDEREPGLWERVFAVNRRVLRSLRDYESGLEDHSFLVVRALPVVQEFMIRHLGLGNEKAYIGRGGWLYYRPDVDHVTGPPFLDARVCKRRAALPDAPHPDSVEAILDFHHQLAARGVKLLVMPVPAKPSIEPEHFLPRGAPVPLQPLWNPSFHEWMRRLEAEGVAVLDISGALRKRRRDAGAPVYLATDTHWTPDGLRLAAELVADAVRHVPGAMDGAETPLTAMTVPHKGRGDLATMLRLPPASALFPPETVPLRRVTHPDGGAWQSDPLAGILLLGDSFSNIYSLEEMGWGSSAGLAEQLAFELRRPVDTILRNDQGASATRAVLASELAKGHDRLAGKRVVVWEFAARELSGGDWKPVHLSPAAAPSDATPQPSADVVFYAPEPGAPAIPVSAVVRSVSPVPRPGSVPYKDHIFAVHLADVEGGEVPPGSQAVVYFFSMRDNKLTAEASWRAGDRVRFALRSWEDVADRLDRFNRSEPADPALQLAPAGWGEPIPTPP